MKYVAYAVLALAVFAGASGGAILKGALTAPPGDHGAEKAAPAAKAEKKGAHAAAKSGHDDKAKGGHDDKAKKAKDDHGGHGDGKNSAEGNYLKFGRQFVAPVIGDAGVRSLLVFDISIETRPGMVEKLYPMEPKLRDALLSTLLSLSNRGAFDRQLLDAANLETIRRELLVAARSVIGEDAREVLILNMARQDV